MQETIYEKDFSTVFDQLLTQTNVTCYRISEFTHIDQGYLSHLRSGTKSNPGPEIIAKISLALAHYSEKITLHDLERLFRSVGRSIRAN